MKKMPQQQRAGARIVGIKAQLAITDNPVFPLSSPIADHRLSATSDASDYILQPQSLFNSQEVTRTHVHSNQLAGKTSDEPSFEIRGREPKLLQHAGKDRPGKEAHIRNKSRPNLHIVTNTKQLQHGQGRVVLNQVNVRRPHEVRDVVLSIVSQEGINALPTPLPQTVPSRTTSNLKQWAHHMNTKTSFKADKPKKSSRSGTQRTKSPTNRSSVIFGLSVPEHEARLHGQTGGDISAVTLITPWTPRIVVTPVEEEPRSLHVGLGAQQPGQHARQTSPSSLYSSIALDESPQQSIYPPPPADPVPRRRGSSDSQQQTLVGSSDTIRPKSQGWWNLVASPILSRMGTLKSYRGRSSAIVPPVPKLPTITKQDDLVKTPEINISPETPRRLGLADVRTSSWSRWTETEYGTNNVDDECHSDIEQGLPTQPRDCLTYPTAGPTHLGFTDKPKREGLAVEYYRACAVEQLANITYFECTNHSCANGLPKLKSIFDMPKHLLPLDGSTNRDNGVPSFESNSVNDLNHLKLNKGGLNGSHDANHANETFSIDTVDVANEKDEVQSPDLDEVVSPNVRQAKTAILSKAKTINSREPSPIPVSNEKNIKAKQLKILPAASIISQPAVDSPGPLSPEATRTIAPTGALPMAPLQSLPANSTAPLFVPVPRSNHALVNPYQTLDMTNYPYNSMPQQQFHTPPPPQYAADSQSVTGTSSEPNRLAFGMAPNAPPATVVRQHEEEDETSYQAHVKSEIINDDEKDKRVKNKRKVWKIGMFCCTRKRKAKQPKARRRIIGIAALLIMIIVGCILFAIFFVRGKSTSNPIDSQWLNLTGYPPLPTGISTIAQPNLAASQNRCVEPTTMWSCSLPKEEQSSIGSNSPDQPNFRFQIRFLNGTVPANMTIPISKRAENPSAGELFAPNPTPPGKLDQLFLGNTTDNITRPFDGEATPFFITFMNADVGSSSTDNSSRKLSKRQTSNNNSLDASIPAPAIAPDGSAAPATLLPTAPFPFSQPLKLYNRGLRDEHYGFYIYYDKSVFLSGVVLQSGNSSSRTLTADQNGGSSKQAATTRCTWSQTRYLVKIFTNPSFGGTLLQGPVSNTTTSKQEKNSTSSATNFIRPGSFPYPTSILLDRHGGDVNKKLIYCYGMNSGTIVNNLKVLVPEFRAFGGVLVNGSPQFLNQGGGPAFDSSLGGIDGGTGGCGCTWQNWS